MPLEIPEAIKPPQSTKVVIPFRQQRLDTLLKSAPSPAQKQIQDTFAQKGLPPDQLKSRLDSIQVDDYTKHDIWDTYYMYEAPPPPVAPPTPPPVPGLLMRIGNAAVDLIPTDKIRNMPPPSVPKVPAGVPEAAEAAKRIASQIPQPKIPGNIKNLYDRKVLDNKDGSYSTTSSVSFGFPEGEVLLPTVVDGVRLTTKKPDGSVDYSKVIERYRQTGEHLGIFDTPEHADAFASDLHNKQAANRKTSTADAVVPPAGPVLPKPPAPISKPISLGKLGTLMEGVPIVPEIAGEAPLHLTPSQVAGIHESPKGFSVVMSDGSQTMLPINQVKYFKDQPRLTNTDVYKLLNPGLPTGQQSIDIKGIEAERNKLDQQSESIGQSKSNIDLLSAKVRSNPEDTTLKTRLESLIQGHNQAVDSYTQAATAFNSKVQKANHVSQIAPIPLAGEQPFEPMNAPKVPMGPQKETNWWDYVKGLPQALRTVREENLKKSTWQAFRDTMGTIVGGAGGLLQGASMDYYEPEKGTLTLPRRLLNELVFQPQFIKTDKGWQRTPSAPDPIVRIHEPLSSVLEKDWGVPADLAQNGTMPDIGKFFGTIAPWSRVSSGISGALAGASELSEVSAIAKIGAEGAVDAGNAKKAYDITKGILKNAGIQAATGEVIAHLEKAPDNETPEQTEIRAAQTAMYGAAFSAIFDGVAHILQNLPKAKPGTLTAEAQQTVDDVMNDVYDAFYRSGSFSSPEAARAAAERTFMAGMRKGNAPEEILDSIKRRFADNEAARTGRPTEAPESVPPVPEVVPQAPEVVPPAPAATAPATEVEQPEPKVKASALPEIPSIPTPEAAAPIPSPTAEVEKPETPPKPVTPEALGIPAPKKQFTHDGQFVVGISDGKIVLADGSTVERAPSYIKTLGMFGYKELTPEQIGGLAGLAAANETTAKEEPPAVPIAVPPPPLAEGATPEKLPVEASGQVGSPDVQTPFIASEGAGPKLKDTREGRVKPVIEKKPKGEVPAPVEGPITIPEKPGVYTVVGGKAKPILGKVSIEKFASGEFAIHKPDGEYVRTKGSSPGHIPVVTYKTVEEAQAAADRVQKEWDAQTGAPAVPEPETVIKPKGTQELISGEDQAKELGPRWFHNTDMGRAVDDGEQFWLDGEDEETANAGIIKSSDSYSVQTRDGRTAGPFESLDQAASIAEQMFPQRGVGPKVPKGIRGPNTKGELPPVPDSETVSTADYHAQLRDLEKQLETAQGIISDTSQPFDIRAEADFQAADLLDDINALQRKAGVPPELRSQSMTGSHNPASGLSKGELPNVPAIGTTESQSGEVHAEGTTPTDGDIEAAGNTEPSAGPESGTGTTDSGTVPGKGTRSGRDTRTGGRGTDAITRGGIDNSGFYRITDADELGSGGATTKFKDNLKAIRILKALMAEERLPTPEERQAMVRYVGWGGLSESAFNLYNRDSREMAQELEKLLSPEEYEKARASTKNAHYTSAEVIRYIWSLAERMGFNGNGTILETSMGTGNFLGLAPDAAVKKGNFIGAELDPITGNIAKYLYPGAAIRIGGYETLMLPDNSVDLAIGNVPFGDYKIYDPLYKDLKLLIHDYFFIKTLDKIRPGGLVMFITSKGTLDKANDRVRDLIADKANLVAAYRLPNTAFKTNARTEVTTDIIILQKRSPEDLRGGEPFLKLQEIGDDGIKVNEYFAKHPENMFGKMTLGGTMYRGNEPTLEPTEPLETLMAKALLSAPSNVMKAKPRASAGKTPSIVDTVAPDTVKELAYTINDKGQLVQRIHGVLTKPQDAAVSNKLPQMKELIGIREQVKIVIAMQLQSSDDVPLKVEQEELSKLYDAYVKRHGFLSAKGSDIFSEDPQYPLLLALENYNRESKSATKSDIFEKRTIRPIIPLETVSSNPKEGLIQVLADRGFPDIQFLAQLSKQSEDDVVRSLEKDNIIFQNPGSGSFEMGPVYLSGYVRDKLEAAKHAAKQDPKYQRNVEALEAIQPAPIPIKDISVKLGATWVPQAAYQSFIREAILAGTGNHRTVKVTRLPDGAWDVEFQSSGDINIKWGSDYLSPAKIMESGMNMKRPTIWRDDGDGGKFVDQKATIAAREKLHLMKEEFQKWASSSPDWAEKLEGVYNKEYNGIRLMKYDGSHLTLPGISSEITLNPHQKNGVWRVITDGRALLAHVVGSGKTFTMIAAAMELKRLGISKKNLFVVPNGKVEQWRAMFQALYPAANILAVGRDDLAGDARRQSISRIATGDWDAVIVQHSSFGRIPISPERMGRTIQNEMDELEETLRSSKAQGMQDRDPTIKALEKAKSRLEAHLKALQDAPKDNVINFDELGVDYMFVDELHEFKNLAYYTKMNNISGLGQKDAKKGLDLKSKTDYIQEKNRGRGVVGATGTPISNSMAEAYNMMRYVAPDVLTNAGIKFFDDWAANFGDVVEVMELSPDGRTYRARAKFSKFTNTPELMTMFRSFTDVKHAHELNLPTPHLKGGQPQPVKIRSNDVIEPIFQDLLARAESLRANPSQSREKGSDNWLKLTGDGKKIALDARLFDADLPDHPDSKSNVAVSEIFKRYQGQKDTTQVVFADMYQDKTERFNLYKDMKQKLVEKGVPAKEIAIAHDFKNDDQLEKMQTQMNAGKIRILFGSTAKIGVGLNIQQKLSALHDLDAPWRPDQLEQRHGRIVRQGNKNKEVEILQYVTERSFDAYIFQALETKARFIRQIMSGQISGRNIDDAAGDVVLQYAELKAIASGNPDVKRKIELETQIHRLDSLESSHLADEMRRKMKIRENEGRVADLHAQSSHLEDTKKLYEKYLANHIKQDKVTPFDAIVGGKDINDSDGFVAYVDNNKDVALRTGAVATIYGVPIKFETYESAVRELDDEGNLVRDGKGNSIWIKVPAYRYLLANAWEDIPDTGAAGLLLSLKHHLDRLGATIKQREEWAQESERQIKSIRGEMGKPFDHQEELDAARKELIEVDKRLAPPPETASQDALLDVEDDPNAKRPEVGTTDTPNSPEDGAGQVGDIPPPVTGPSDLTKNRNAKLPNSNSLAIPKAPIDVGDKTYTSHIFPIARADGTSQSLSGWEIGPGLAVTDYINRPGSFQILHTVSGLSVAQTFSAKQAISIAEKLLRLGDWTRSAEDFKTDTEFMNGVRAVVKLNESQRGSFSLFSKSAPPPIQPSLIPSPDKDMEQMASIQGPKKNIWEELKRLPADLKRLVTSGRYNEDIKDFPVFAERVRRAQEIILDAHGKAVHRIYQTLKGLHPTEYSVFRAIVLWEDMYETAARSGEQSIPLPGTNKLARIDAEITRLRNLSTPAVLDAVDRHHAWMEEMWDEFVRRGKVDPNDGRIKYFPNMIIHEFGDALNRLPGLPTRMQTPRRLYLKERKGHQTPHTADYIKVMEQYATRAYAHNMIDDFIDRAATENDVFPTLSAQDRQQMFAPSNGSALEPGSIVHHPDGRVLKVFQFNPGRVLYPVNAINENVIRDAAQAGLDELAIDIDAFRINLPSTDLDTVAGDRLTRKAIALGGQHKTYLLPIEIADKLEHFRDQKSMSAFTEMFRAATQVWKVQALTFAGPAYHFANLVGDLFTLYMEDIAAFKQFPLAFKLLKNKLPPAQYNQLVQMIEDARIWNSTFISSGEVPRAIDTPQLRQYRENAGFQKINPFGSNPIGDAWREFQRWGNIRESLPRLAKFLADVERVQNGLPVVTNGVALRGLDPYSILAAGKIGREYNVDYLANSPVMRLAYSTIFPFMKYHVAVIGPWMRRASHKGKIFPGDEFLLKVVLGLYISAFLWNHFMYPDVEEKLEDWQKEMRHINTPYKDKDGKPLIITLEVPTDIVLRWGGLHTLEANLDRVTTGEWTTEQAARQQLEDIFGHQKNSTLPTAPGAVIEQLMNPMIKVYIDLQANKDSFTGKQIVSTDSPNLWGDRSRRYPQTVTGKTIYAEYIIKKLISPYMQFLRASQTDDPDTPISNWFKQSGPFGWKKALGIRSVNPDAVARGNWYEMKNWNQALYDEKIQKITDAYVEFGSGNITAEERDALIEPMIDQAGPMPTFAGDESDVYKIQQRPQFKIRVLQEMVRKEKDPETKLALQDKIKSLRYQVDKESYENTPEKVRKQVGLPPVPQP